MNMTASPPVPSVRHSEKASLASRFQPVSRNLAKKLENASQRSCRDCQVSASEESIQESMPSQSIIRFRPPCLKNQSCIMPGLVAVSARYRDRERSVPVRATHGPAERITSDWDHTLEQDRF